MIIRNISDSKDMSNGMRNMSRSPLSEEEIEFVKKEIQRIGADESKFIFNAPDHVGKSTCYDYVNDVIYVTRNVFPDEQYTTNHPRDLLSVAAVLAHEYYGHRTFREEYLSDLSKGKNYHTVSYWEDEYRASMTASKIAPNLTPEERRYLVLEAMARAEEAGQCVKMDEYMKEVIYGDLHEKNITPNYEGVNRISKAGNVGNDKDGGSKNKMSKVQKNRRSSDDFER